MIGQWSGFPNLRFLPGYKKIVCRFYPFFGLACYQVRHFFCAASIKSKPLLHGFEIVYDPAVDARFAMEIVYKGIRPVSDALPAVIVDSVEITFIDNDRVMLVAAGLDVKAFLMVAGILGNHAR